jgi:hypothetical protein
VGEPPGGERTARGADDQVTVVSRSTPSSLGL